MILNKLEKNYKKLKPWAEKYKIEAFRLYDKDIPEFPFLVDIYKNFVVIYDKTELVDQGKNKDLLIIQAVQTLLNLTSENIVYKKRERQKGLQQYQKIQDQNKKIVVLENGIPVYVNLWDYLDTGLFIDHRPILA